MAKFQVNGSNVDTEGVPEDTPLLWLIREQLHLNGRGLCGECTVHLNGQAIRSCLIPLSAANGGQVTTIEGLSPNADHPLQRAWIEEQVPQCGYCQSGQIMQAAALLARNPSPSDAEIVSAMNGNLCRCGTYLRIKRAIRRAAGTLT